VSFSRLLFTHFGPWGKFVSVRFERERIFRLVKRRWFRPPRFSHAIFTHTKNKKRNDSKKGKSYLGDARSDAKRFRRTSRKPRTIVQTRQTLCVEWSAICGVLAAENAKEKVRVKIRIKNKKSLGGELDFSHLKCSCWFLSSSSFVHTQKYFLEKVHKKAHTLLAACRPSAARERRRRPRQRQRRR